MKLLIDTNIFIPLEPTSPEDVTAHTTLAAELVQLATKTGIQIWLHPAQRVDIAQDATEGRRSVREQLFRKYPVLDITIPAAPATRTNDWVDQQLINALQRNAVTALVTEDRKLTRDAIAAAGADRVLTLADAVSLLRSLLSQEVEPPPAVEAVRAFDLEGNDSFWDSFREQYPGFDNWFRKCQEEHRQAWVIRAPATGDLAGVAIVNEERSEAKGRKTLKICSLKVDPMHSGRRYGELLLKSVFQYAYENRYDSFLITAFPEHEQLLALLGAFGFEREPEPKPSGELVLVKQWDLQPPPDATADPLAYFVSRGPFALDLHSPMYLVPIRPEFHLLLFPELQPQPALLPHHEAFGNSLRKAYLSSSAIAEMPPGSVLLFYRTVDEHAIRSWGVVEQTLRSTDLDEICSFVLPRTVYTREQIEERLRRGAVLAIMFRQCLARIDRQISLTEMSGARVLSAAPQSITQLQLEPKEWMVERCRKLF
ncbi:MAG: GNAT family N-acetyltransferase [Armatimonadetes bacterium]|nr:GNAT family N-acetyltransferase [Armatimonadota bacterium]NOG93814.1 GNAT family N-acetyltransferase [Armatimonadota bacterium]